MKGQWMILPAALLSGAVALAASPPSEGPGFFAGLVISVDAANRVVKVEEAGSDRILSFSVPAQTPMTKDGQPFLLAAVRVDDPSPSNIERRARGRRPSRSK